MFAGGLDGQQLRAVRRFGPLAQITEKSFIRQIELV
jgi:hypothetical protein